MLNVAISLARGFFTRLTGYLASGGESVARVIELAFEHPTSTKLSDLEADTLIGLGQSSMKAAKDWHDGAELGDSDIPKIPGPVYPNINGGEDGKYQFGLVINEPGSGEQGDPIFFSDDKITDVEKVLANLYDYISEGQGRDSVPFYNELLTKLQENRRDVLIPLWLYEYISPSQYTGPK